MGKTLLFYPGPGITTRCLWNRAWSSTDGAMMGRNQGSLTSRQSILGKTFYNIICHEQTNCNIKSVRSEMRGRPDDEEEAPEKKPKRKISAWWDQNLINNPAWELLWVEISGSTLRTVACFLGIRIVCKGFRSDKNQDFEEIKRNDNTIRFVLSMNQISNREFQIIFWSPPRIMGCATMWHETTEEIEVFVFLQLLFFLDHVHGIMISYCFLQKCNHLTVEWSSVTLLKTCWLFRGPKRILTVLSQLQLLLFVFVHSNC